MKHEVVTLRQTIDQKARRDGTEARGNEEREKKDILNTLSLSCVHCIESPLATIITLLALQQEKIGKLMISHWDTIPMLATSQAYLDLGLIQSSGLTSKTLNVIRHLSGSELCIP